MQKQDIFRRSLLRGSAPRAFTLMGGVAALTLASAPALAQTAPDEAVQGPADTAPQQEIVVTGSRIARPNLESTVPIASIAGDELAQTGRVSTGDVLNDLPQLQSTFSQSNSTRFLGTAGLNLLDLRGLGPQRTLVLVNGRRHVGSDILSNAVSPDINTIPTDLIERIDTVTGGNSAIYGSDAIAGVVNFVLKDHYEGVQVRGQGGISQYGDAGSYYTSVLAGKNFADGRGNIAIDLEYARQNDFYGSDRDYLRTADGFVVVDTDPAGVANGSDGIPDRTFFHDIRPATYSNQGNILFDTGMCGHDASGANFRCSYIFNPDGSLVPQTGSRAGIAPNGSYIGGNGSTAREGQLLQILPQMDRYSANLIGHFEISDALVPFVEAKYVRTDVFGTGSSGPAFFQGGTLGDSREQPRLDNPFLTAQARSVIEQQLLLQDPTAEITDATQFALRKNLVDLGVRSEESKRETYRIVGGLRGTFNDDWHYEVSGNYGEFHERTKVLGNLNVQRFLLAMDSTRNAAGQIVCRSQIDPAARIGYIDEGDILANDIQNCVALNPFGQGNISDEARDYVLTDTVAHGKITQFVGSGFISGDSSQWFELPGGPVGFAVGAEYRRETAYFREDPLVEQGYTFYNAIQEFDPPSFEVKEAYAELRLPILADIPFFEELTVSGAGRVADYKGSTGTVYSYNAGVDWKPIEDIHFRANYSRAVRAPNLADLYSPQGQNFAPGFADPCSARNIGTGSANRAANCAAAGIPASYDYVYNSSLEILSGGNPDLREETSDSYTYGVVLQPQAIPGLSLSVDYFNIKVNNVITAPDAQQIVDACYDAADLNNQFCGLFERAGASGGPNGEEPFRIIEGSLQQTLLNYAKLQTRGIDTELSYRHSFGGFDLASRLAYTHVFQNDEFLDPTDPDRANRLLSELGVPKDAFNFDLDLSAGSFFMNYQLRYLSHMVVNEYEDFFSFQGRDPENADYADIHYYPDVVYHDIRLGVNIDRKSSFYVGVDNLTNRRPPLGSTGIGAGSGIYEPRGRFFYAGVTAGF